MAEDKKTKIGEVKLTNVRLSFAHIFRPQEGKIDEETGKKGQDKYNCSFLMDKNTEEGRANALKLKRAREEVSKAKWGNDIPKLKPEKLCVRDGDLEDYDGYAGMLYCSASNSKKPVVVTRKASVPAVEGQPQAPYSGCYVHAVVNVWAQDNKHGKRINASLEAIQFVRDGEAFGAKAVDPNEAFGDVDEETDAMEEVGGDDDDLI